MKEWVNLSAIAAALGRNKSTIGRRAQREGWRTETKGRETRVDVRSLPEAVRTALLECLLTSGTTPDLPAPTPVQPGVSPSLKRPSTPGLSPPVQSTVSAAIPTDPGQIKAWQRRCMEARLALLAEVDRLALAGGLMQARDTVARAASEGRLAPELQAQVAVANQRGGKAGTRGLAAASLRRWDEARQKHGNLALAPRPTIAGRTLPPAWMPAFVGIWATPGKRSIADCHEEAVSRPRKNGLRCAGLLRRGSL